MVRARIRFSWRLRIGSEKFISGAHSHKYGGYSKTLHARGTGARDGVRPVIRTRGGRRLAQSGTDAPATPVRLAPGRHRLARVEHAGTALLAGDTDLGRGVATQRRPARRARAAGETR